jgi:hypothetical protein
MYRATSSAAVARSNIQTDRLRKDKKPASPSDSGAMQPAVMRRIFVRCNFLWAASFTKQPIVMHQQDLNPGC